MSDSKQGGGEPSMEEILASIRKIISEDTADDGQKNAGTAGSDDAAPARAGGDGAAASSASTAGVGDDVLELSDDAAAELFAEEDADIFPFAQSIESDAGQPRPFVGITEVDGELQATRIVEGEERAASIEVAETPGKENQSGNGVNWRDNKFIS